MHYVRGFVVPMAAAVLVLLAGCAKKAESKQEDPLFAVAAATIKEGIEKPEPALCSLTFERPMTSRNIGEFGPAFPAFCLPSDAAPTLKNCWSALKEQKVGLDMNKRFPECLWPMEGTVTVTEYKAAGITFPCGSFSSVQVTKLDKSDPERLRASYKLAVDRNTDRVSAIERQCGDVTWPEAQEKSVSLFKSGTGWALPGR
jgi:hypothetical protein